MKKCNTPLFPDIGTKDHTFIYDVNIEIEGVISENANIMIGLFAFKSFDENTVRLIKKVKQIKGNDEYSDFSRSIHFELDPWVDLEEGETHVRFGYLIEGDEDTNNLTSVDKEKIKYDFTFRRKKDI